MSWRDSWARWRDLLESGITQSFGSAAALLTTVLLARFGGAELQGRYSLVKAELDFLTALLLCGLPQAVFYFLEKGRLSVSVARQIIVAQTVIGASIALAWKTLVGTASDANSGTALLAGAYGAALGGMLGFAVVRAAILALQSSRVFSFYSAAPSVLVLVGVIVAFLVNGKDTTRAELALVFASAYGATLLVGFGMLVSSSSPRKGVLGASLMRQLAAYGAATWMASISQAACVFGLLYWVESQLGGSRAAGVFAAGLALVLVVVTPLNLIVPILFRNWSRASSVERRREFVDMAVIVVAGAGIGVAAMAVFGSEIVSIIFGQEYIQHAHTMFVLFLGVAPECVLRLCGVSFNSTGHPWITVVVEAVRLALLGTGILAFGNSLVTVAWIWVLAFVGAMFIALSIALGWTPGREGDRMGG